MTNGSMTQVAKPRYEILDGLRGVAAFYILIYHLFEGAGVMLGHGYLGVDFFYALSGFVIGYAYDSRWGTMTMREFFKRRIIRLHPLVLMGTFIGLAFFFWGESAAFPKIASAPWWMILSLFVYCSFMLPMPPAWDIHGGQGTNSFNENIWSLYWEYAANILYAFVFRRLPLVALIVLAGVAGLGTIDLALNLDVFGVFATERTYAAYTVNGGWSLTAAHLYIGAVRLFYPFIIGLIFARLKGKCNFKVPGGFWTCSFFLLALLMTPQLGGIVNGTFDAFSILILLPLLLCAGAGSEIKGKKTTAICRFLGEMSYPLYITHGPFTYMQLAWVTNHPDASSGKIITLSTLMFFVCLAVAYAAWRLYDLPVRAWLSKRFLKYKIQQITTKGE